MSDDDCFALVEPFFSTISSIPSTESEASLVDDLRVGLVRLVASEWPEGLLRCCDTAREGRVLLERGSSLDLRALFRGTYDCKGSY